MWPRLTSDQPYGSIALVLDDVEAPRIRHRKEERHRGGGGGAGFCRVRGLESNMTVPQLKFRRAPLMSGRAARAQHHRALWIGARAEYWRLSDFHQGINVAERKRPEE